MTGLSNVFADKTKDRAINLELTGTVFTIRMKDSVPDEIILTPYKINPRYPDSRH